MSKGSRRRISLIPEAELQRRWDKAFGKKKKANINKSLLTECKRAK